MRLISQRARTPLVLLGRDGEVVAEVLARGVAKRPAFVVPQYLRGRKRGRYRTARSRSVGRVAGIARRAIRG
eukprot:2484742-Rhodomonas_salina.3